MDAHKCDFIVSPALSFFPASIIHEMQMAATAKSLLQASSCRCLMNIQSQTPGSPPESVN